MAQTVGALAVLVLVYLPGHFLGGWLVRKGDGWAELVVLRISAAVAVATPVLVALSLLGWFTRPVILGVSGVCTIACAVVAWVSGERDHRVRLGGGDIAALGLGAVAFALYARPAEYVINDRDPGVYAVVAAKLARTGELLSRDPLVGATVPFHHFTAWTKYPGLYIYGNDLIVPQFFPGPFAWLGLGNLIGGLWAELYVVPVFGALSVITLFLLGRELFGRWAGAIGAALLSVSFVQVWWARHPSSEVMTQLFVLGGLLFAARFVNGAGRGNGWMAGLMLGGAMLVRIDAVLALAALPLMVGRDLLLRHPVRGWVPLCAPLVLFGGAALLFANTIGGRYLNLIYRRHGLERLLELSPYIAAAALITVLALWMARRRWSDEMARLLEAHGRSLALGGALVLAAAALWAYYVMPVPWISLPDEVAAFHDYDAQVVARMVWFVTPVVAVLGVSGFLLAAHRIDGARLLLLGAVAGFGVAYVILPNVAPDLPWATRRFVPAVFPGLSLLAGYAVVELGRALGRLSYPRTGAAVAGTLVAVALAFTVYAAFPVYGARELGGAVETFDRLDREIPDSRVIYVDAPGDDYASALDYLYGRPTLAYDRKRFEKESEKLRRAGLLENAVYVTVGGEPAPSVTGLDMREVGSVKLDFPRLKPTFKERPTRIGHLRDTLRIYEMEKK